ncbi:MAG: hypothetical protein RJQ01_11040 [Microcella sp.]|uniref:hypothetical protein n=1 Tax=Microcella sp. TaxID=1913979 RepID=UPI0033161032
MPRGDRAVIAHRLERREARDGQRGRRDHVDAGRDAGQRRGVGNRVLGETAVGCAEHLVADREVGRAGAEGDDRAGDVEPGDRLTRRGHPEHRAHDVGQPGHDVPHAAVDAGGADAEQHLALARLGHVEAVDAQHVGGAVAALHDGAHGRGNGGDVRGHGGLLR